MMDNVSQLPRESIRNGSVSEPSFGSDMLVLDEVLWTVLYGVEDEMKATSALCVKGMHKSWALRRCATRVIRVDIYMRR